MTGGLVLAGGGLANCLIAFRLRQLRPEVEVTLIERESTLGGEHVWSFHGTDLTAAQLEWLAPLIERSWSGYEVRFPDLERRLDGSYHSLTSKRLDRLLTESLGERVVRGGEIADVGPHHVRLTNGTVIEGEAVIDGRGAEPSPALRIAFQKFLGLHVELEEPSGLAGPILMDATVEQRDGFRFIYTLPFGDRSLLIEDTRYSDGPELDAAEMRSEISAYAARRGWRVRRVVDEEQGALPIVLAGSAERFWRRAPRGVPRSGMRALLFHQTTGYSLPDAVRLADEIAAADSLSADRLDRLVRARSLALWRSNGFFRLLNRMLFLAAEPELRYRVLERFYRLPEPLIERFYAGRPTWADRARVLTGRPPVPLGRALASLLPGSVPKPSLEAERR